MVTVWFALHTHSLALLTNGPPGFRVLWICLQVGWNQSLLDTRDAPWWKRDESYHVLEMVWLWLQLLAFVTQLVSVIVLPNFIFPFSHLPSPHVLLLFFFPADFLFHFRASLAKVLSAAARASCLTFASLTLSLCALNRNPVNPSSNGVHWEPYQTWPLGSVHLLG